MGKRGDYPLMSYPKIILSETNSEINDCALFPAMVGLFADFTLNDGNNLSFADILDYKDGVFHLSMAEASGFEDYQVLVPIRMIDTITYI